MALSLQTKDERINLRLKHNAKLILERAASFEGQSVSKFILNSALSRAEKTIHDHELMRLNAQDSNAFFNALTTPISFNNKLLTALQEHDQRVISK